MDIDSGHTFTKQKQGFSKIKKILKPLLPRKPNRKKSPIKNNDDSSSFNIYSKKYMNKNKKSRVRGLKLLSVQDDYSLNSNNKTVTSSSKSRHSFSESDSDHGSCNTFESQSSIGTWTSDHGDHDMMFDNFGFIHNDDHKSCQPSNFNIDITKNYKDVMNAASTGLMNSSSSHTLYVKDMIDEDGANKNRNIELNSESSSDIDFINTLSSSSVPSVLSLGSMSDKYYSNNVPQWVVNNKKNKNKNMIPPSPPSTPLPPSIFNSKRNLKEYHKGKHQTPPILSYFPCEILVHIAMSSDFDTILSLKQTCRFFYSILNIPSNWADYWKYTSDRVECLNSLVTSVFQGDEYIFGEILEPTNDKYITNMKKDQNQMEINDSCHSSHVRPNYIYKMPNDPGMEIPIDKILFIDYFSTRRGFSYLGGLRIYVPYEYGNNIVHFYDRTAQELPCSLEHYQDYERNKLKNDLVTNTNALELPSPVQECTQCNQYYHTNCIDYTVTCSGRPVSHISAIWKYQVTPKYTISFDIINSRSEYGYGYRTQDAFIHTNYSFLVNSKELSPAKAALFRKYVLKSS